MKSLPTQDQERKKVRFTCWHLQLLFKRNSPEQREGERKLRTLHYICNCNFIYLWPAARREEEKEGGSEACGMQGICHKCQLVFVAYFSAVAFEYKTHASYAPCTGN